MEFIGIDIGDYKTIMATSKNNGRILGDEQSKRCINTVLELTTPLRKFGNNITGEHLQSIDLRHSCFRDNLLTKEGCTNMYMFINYLKKLIKLNSQGSPSVCVNVPSYFTDNERRVLYELINACGLKLEKFYNGISAVGMFACLRRENVPKRFMVIDFGHSKTEVGVFEFENFVFKTTYVDSLRIGAADFDKKLLALIMKKYKIDDTKFVRAVLTRHLEKIKTALNNLQACGLQIYIGETPYTIQVTREEYEVACADESKEIAEFLQNVFSAIAEEDEIPVNVVGGNSSSFIIRKIMESYKYQSPLDLTESCVYGATFGLAYSFFSDKFKIHDAVARNYSVKLIDADQNPSLVFKKTDHTDTTKTVTYNKKSGFSIEIQENDQPIGFLKIVKDDSEEPEAVKISFRVNKFGFIEVLSVKVDDKDVQHNLEVYKMSSDILDELVEEENKYKKIEYDIELIGNMRNNLQTIVMNFSEMLERHFTGIITEDDISRVKCVAIDLFDVEPSSEIEQEEKLKDDTIQELNFIAEKLYSIRDIEEYATILRKEPVVVFMKHFGEWEIKDPALRKEEQKKEDKTKEDDSKKDENKEDTNEEQTKEEVKDYNEDLKEENVTSSGEGVEEVEDK